ncbi:unnamed protein product [Pipistrellus nathusii]|uniref:Uncharacterized protein n=1 Tax=Pipistrellus nathusii TaxID=59473 RepID=A0ABN9ZRP4_PIPNA
MIMITVKNGAPHLSVGHKKYESEITCIWASRRSMTPSIPCGGSPLPSSYCSQLEKSMCATSCPGREVSVDGNATERWCLLGEMKLTGSASRHQTPPPQSSNRTEQGQTRGRVIQMRED